MSRLAAIARHDSFTRDITIAAPYDLLARGATAVVTSGMEMSGGDCRNACGGEILHMLKNNAQLNWLTQSDHMSYGHEVMAIFSIRSVPNCVML